MIKPAVLVVLDGWGVAPPGEGNAIRLAKTPVLDDIGRRYPTMTLRASGEAVGLSWGEMGNSEVGHLTIGAGRVYYQTLPRIDREIVQGDFFQNAAFKKAMAIGKGRALHLIGLVSPGKVHAMDSHCQALLTMAAATGVKNVFVHAILDGRDTLYNSGHDFIAALQNKMTELGVGKIATLSGRFYAMDRDNRWDRTAKAYNAIARGEAEVQAADPLEAIKVSYAKEIFDEQLPPTVIIEDGGPVATIAPGDAVVFFNFRADRMRQLTKALVLPDFDKFPRPEITNLTVVTMTEYEKGLPVEVAYRPESIVNTLAEVVAGQGLRQLHIAETEKYAHVTFFLNGTREEPFAGEERVIIPSPRVAAYDEVPEMSALEVGDRVVKEIKGKSYDLIVANFANGDMVGHTGNLAATIKACQTVDQCLGRIVAATLEAGGVVLITADHGNAEEVKNLQTGEIDKEHSTNPVPFYVVGASFEGQASPSGEVPGGDLSLMPPVGMLADVAPTILKLMGIDQPGEMTGTPLV